MIGALQSILTSAAGLNQQVPMLLYALSSPYWSDRLEAANGLGEIGVAPRPEVISSILSTLSNERFQVNDVALRSLWILKPDMLLPQQPISDTGFVPTGPLTFLGLCNGKAYHDVLREYLTDEMWERRALAARMLQWAGITEDVPALIEALEDPHPTVRAMAMRSLGGLIDDPGLIRVALTAYQDPNVHVRVAAIEALKNQTLWLTDEAFSTLVEALNHPDAEVRLAAATVLMAKTGWDCELVSTASPTLVATLDDESEAVRQMAQETLDRLAMFCP